MSDWLTRGVIYVVVLFLIMIVYAGQMHDNARDTLRSALRRTAKGLAYTAVLIAVIVVLELLFID